MWKYHAPGNCQKKIGTFPVPKIHSPNFFIHRFLLHNGPLPVINGVITPINGLING